MCRLYGAATNCYQRVRKDAAPGVDGVDKAAYGDYLERNLADLHARLKTRRYRHQPIRRVHIPKGQGKTRPIGISAFEDKLFQGALRDVLEAVYEQDFLDCSHGFRPGRSTHDAVRSLTRIVDQGEVKWILEADIMSFFDSMDRTMLKEMLQIRVADGSLLRLIGKCLHVGILDAEQMSTPELGAVQGSSLSPLLGNIYLHYALDLWFETAVKSHLRGKATLIRYCDDFVTGFEREDDARRVMEVLPKRLGKYGLTLHPDKTRLLPFGRPPLAQSRGKGLASFDFLGFTFYWARSRKGYWRISCKTLSASLRRAISSISAWCRVHRHQPLRAQHAALSRRMRGHYNYFGVSGNFLSLLYFSEAVKRSWHKWLCRRSQRNRLPWDRFAESLKTRWALPRPQISVNIWS